MDTEYLEKLIRCHGAGDEEGFFRTVCGAAAQLEKEGRTGEAERLRALATEAATDRFSLVQGEEYSDRMLLLPEDLDRDVRGILRDVNTGSGNTRFLLKGAPGTGKTSAAVRAASLLHRDIRSADFRTLLPGAAEEGLRRLFKEISLCGKRHMVLLEHLEAVPPEAAPVLLQGLEQMPRELFAVGELSGPAETEPMLDRLFDVTVSFDCYSLEDLAETVLAFLEADLRAEGLDPVPEQHMELLRRSLLEAPSLPSPGEIRDMVRRAVREPGPGSAVSRVWRAVYGEPDSEALLKLKERGWSVRETEVLTGVAKSTASSRMRRKAASAGREKH